MNIMQNGVLNLDNKASSVHVALAVYDPNGTYSQHAGVVMTSIFENTKSHVVVHVLHDETLTDDNRKNFIRTAEKYNQSVDLIDVKECRTKLNRDALALVEKIYSVGALYRLFIPNLLNLDRVIYLDCDVVVNLDIRELWDTDLEGNCLGAVQDRICGVSCLSNDAICAKLNGCNLASYINSGILLMDLNHIRGWGDLPERTLAWLSEHQHSVKYPDQDALNALFSDSIKLLDPKFNYFSYSRDPNNQGENLCGRIVHFIDRKPWRELTGLATERLYWKTLIKSAWGENMTLDDIIDAMSHAASISPQLHRHTKQCYKQIGERLIKDILHPDFFATIWVMIRELYARLKWKQHK